MLITIDTTKDSAAAITAACEFAKVVLANVPTGTPLAPTPPVAPAMTVVSAQTALDEEAARVFAANSVKVPPVPLDSTPAAAPTMVDVAPPAAPAPTTTVIAASPSSIPVPPPIPAPPGSTTEVERDTNGVAYDARIHNKSRTKKQDGSWKLAKGIDPVLVAAVLQELTGSTETTIVPAAVAPVAPTPPASAPAAPIPDAPQVAASVLPGPVSVGITFRETMAKVNVATAAGKITKADVDAALIEVGLKAGELAPLVLPINRPLLEAFNALLSSKIGA
jgi:hypothetical protein